MKYTKSIFYFFLFTLSLKSFAVVELGADFGYDQKLYGLNNESKRVNRTYSGSLAFYFSTLTAIEFHYSYDDQRTTDRSVAKIDSTDNSITGKFNQVNQVVYGIGLKQALAHRKARIRPLISAGYARQSVEDGSIYTIRNDLDGSSFQVNGEVFKATFDSVFVSFLLQVRLIGGLSLKGSVYSVFEAFEWSEAKNDLKYKVGLSWAF